jgi:protein-S-isoprenylcysteine O-methyltransferase Ste14
MVPVFGVLLANALATAGLNAVELAPLSFMSISRVARDVLVLGFYCLLLLLYLLRGRARASSRSPLVNTAAIVATLLPFILPLRVPPARQLYALAGGDLIMLAGLGWSLWALAVLGKNISIIPQARQLVRSGPYAAVRHPLYLGEIITALGLVVGGFSWSGLVLFTIFTLLQVYRAIHEEALLSLAFIDYGDYRATTARFIPGLAQLRLRPQSDGLAAAALTPDS